MSGLTLVIQSPDSSFNDTNSKEALVKEETIVHGKVITEETEILHSTMTTRSLTCNQYQHMNGAVHPDRHDGRPNGGFYNHDAVATYTKSDDATQTETEKESVQVQVPFLTAEQTQTEPIMTEPSGLPYKVQASKKKYAEAENSRPKGFLDYACDVLVFLQDCCTCNGVGGIM